MQIRSIAAASLVAALIHSPLARADEGTAPPRTTAASTASCAPEPRDTFRPESQLRDLVENVFRYRLDRVTVDGGCYSVFAFARNGTPYEVRFRGSDLKMISRYVVKDAPAFAIASGE